MIARTETQGQLDEDGERAEEPPLPLTVDVVHEHGDWTVCEPISEAVLAVGAEIAQRIDLGRAACSACLALSSDADVARLNGLYRGMPKPTNVLSFPAPAERSAAAEGSFLGDVVLARETVLAEAAAAGIPPRHHLMHLVAHGLLHLIGYDHETSEDAAEMEALEVEILAALGVADPYAAGEPEIEGTS